jgi:hypothetical protein
MSQDPAYYLAIIADRIETLTKAISEQPMKDGSLLHSTLAENIRLKESVQRLGEELLQVRMDAAKDPVLLAAIKDSILNPRIK